MGHFLPFFQPGFENSKEDSSTSEARGTNLVYLRDFPGRAAGEE